METSLNEQAEVNKVYDYAAKLLLDEKKSESEVRQALIKAGLHEESSRIVVNTLSQQISDAKKERANKDMLYGALWCVGGTIATIADIGFIFWGAIVFGGIQFFKGLANSGGRPVEPGAEPFGANQEYEYRCTHCGYTQKADFEFCPSCFKNDDGVISE